MKRFLAAASLAALALGLTVTSLDADAARRLGGGKSFGMQRDNSVMKRDAAPAAPAAPPTSAAPAQRPGAAAAPAAPAAQPKRSWLGPLAGLAAGLGIGALLSGSGFGGMMGTLLMGLLIAAAVFMVLRLLRGRQQTPAGAGPGPSPLQYAGAGAPAAAPMRLEPTTGVSDPVPGIRPSASPSSAVSAYSPSPGSIPADFDVEGFLRNAKLNFVRLQAAFDAGNADDLRQFTTPEVFAELKLQLDERGRSKQQTDVVELQTEVLDVTTEPTRYVVSVRYRGALREESGAAPQPFDEVWHLTKPVSGSGGWVVAGIQQMETA